MAQPIDLYYWPTPNGWKVTIFLEEAGDVNFESKPHAIGGSGTRIFFVKDPDGYRIEFIERK